MAVETEEMGGEAYIPTLAPVTMTIFPVRSGSCEGWKRGIFGEADLVNIGGMVGVVCG